MKSFATQLEDARLKTHVDSQLRQIQSISVCNESGNIVVALSDPSILQSLVPSQKPLTKKKVVGGITDTFDMTPIATIESVFREKFGTPKQSGFVEAARATLTLKKELNESSLEGLSGFSYVWIIYVFHKQDQPECEIPEEIKIDLSSKFGMFANRETNRQNRIGMSLAKLEDIEGRTLHLSGIDILDGSPVLDIKPYHYNDAIATPLQNQDVGEESLPSTETTPVNSFEI